MSDEMIDENISPEEKRRKDKRNKHAQEIRENYGCPCVFCIKN